MRSQRDRGIYYNQLYTKTVLYPQSKYFVCILKRKRERRKHYHNTKLLFVMENTYNKGYLIKSIIDLADITSYC